jgi:oligopeptide transport system permease protein
MIADPKKLGEKLETIDEKNCEEGTSLLDDSLRKFKKNKMAVFGCLMITILFTISLIAKIITPYSFDEGKLENQNFPPTWYKVFIPGETKLELTTWAAIQKEETKEDDFFSDLGRAEDKGRPTLKSSSFNPLAKMALGSIDHLEKENLTTYLEISGTSHLLGTDELGRDILSRLIYGMRLSLLLALTVTFVSVLIGVAYGSISGYYGGMIDQVMMRFVDFLFGVPFIFLVILLMVFFGRHVFLIFIGLGLIYWIVLARIVRGQILSIKEKEFVMAAISNGVSEFKIIFKHLVPNVLGPTIVFSTLLVPQIMLLEAFLSFIGLGVSPPDVSLGIMINDGASVLTSFSWPIIFPGFIFSLMIFCMNFIGDGLRDALDPRISK